MRCSCTHTLITSNLGFGGVSVAHFLGGYQIGGWIYMCLGLFSSLYHYTQHVAPQPTLETRFLWEVLDRVFAWLAMFFNWWLFCQNPYASTKICGLVICCSTLTLYFLASKAIANGDLESYNIVHSLWHLCGALGAFLIFL